MARPVTSTARTTGDEDSVVRHRINSPRSFASRRSSNSSDTSGSSDNTIDIPVTASPRLASNGTGLNGTRRAVPPEEEATSVHRQCNKFGFFLDSEEAAVQEIPIAVDVTKRREAKWLYMLSDEKKWSKYVVKRYKRVRNRCRKGVPHTVRGKAWLYLCGGHKKMRIEPGLFSKLDKAEGDELVCDEITKDLHRQFPSHEIFAENGGYGQNDLFRVLKAYSVMKPEIGYCQGQAPLAAVLLMHQPAEDAFWTLIQLCDFFLPGYFSPGLEAIQLHGDMLFSLLKKFYPSAHKLLKKQKVEPILIMTEWFMCLFSRTLPWPIVLRVWDMFMCEGIRVIFKVAIVLIGCVIGSNTPERKECKSMYETLQLCRNIPARYLNEAELIDKVIKLDLTEKMLHHEHAIQSSNRKVKKAIEDKARKLKLANAAAQNNGTTAIKSSNNGTTNGKKSSNGTNSSNGSSGTSVNEKSANSGERKTSDGGKKSQRSSQSRRRGGSIKKIGSN